MSRAKLCLNHAQECVGKYGYKMAKLPRRKKRPAAPAAGKEDRL